MIGVQSMSYEIGEVLITEDEIKAKVAEIAKAVSRDYKGKNLLLTGVLKGAFVFLSDLSRAMGAEAQVDFIKISTYKDGTRPSGEIRFDLDFSSDVHGRHVLLVEDIVDTGRTLSHLVKEIKKKGPASVKICALLDKPSRREAEVEVAYLGFSIPDRFVVGYGLDCAEKFRCLPYIAVVEERG